MKTFGADKELQEKYTHHHIDIECKGVWSFVEESEMPYRIDEGIMIVIKNAPMVKCNTCGAMYFQEGFEEAFLKYLAMTMVLTTRQLSKNEIRFLRSYIGFTQERLANELGTSKTEISRNESLTAKDQRKMDDGLMVRFKLLVAGELGLTVQPQNKFWKVEHLAEAKSKIVNAKDIQSMVS